MSACERVRMLLALRPEDWGEDERRQVVSHLATCAACATIAQEYAAQEPLLRATRARPRSPQWEPLRRRIQRQKRWGAISMRLGAVLTSVVLVALIIALVWGLPPLFERRNERGPSQPAVPGPTATATLKASAPALVTQPPTVAATTTPTPAPAVRIPTVQIARPTQAVEARPTLPSRALEFGYGIQGDPSTDVGQTVDAVQDLGLGWFKHEVRWAQVVPAAGETDWAALDTLVAACDAAGIKVLFTVIGTPGWARDGEPGAGPPDDPQDLADFVGEMAARYWGRVHAYEIWEGQNMRRTWEGAPLSGASYVKLLEAAYQAIKAADPEAVVVSGALDPTGVDDGEWAIDDRVYLQQMYDAGLENACDAVGAHPSGYANPPDVYYKGGDFDPGRVFDDHPSFFFRNTMEDTYEIMEKNGDGEKRVWATEFGWGTPDGLGMVVSPEHSFVNDIDEYQQAQYIALAYSWAREWGHAGPMFLDNLSVSPFRSDLGLLYSILRPDGTPRPAYATLKDTIASSAPTGPVQIVSFSASPSPADPAGAVTLSWDVRGASSVTVQWIDKRSEDVVHAGLLLAGSLSVDLSEVKYSGGDTVRFSLTLHDAEGALMFGADGKAFEERISVPLQTAMRVAFFAASPDPIERGGTVTLSWDAPGAASVGITRLSEEGDIMLATEARDLPASGSLTLQVPDRYLESVSYYLGARDANGVLGKRYVTVGIKCPYDKTIAPRCPLTRSAVLAAYQPFERGHMVWRSDTREIYVLYADGSYEIGEDTWQEGDPIELPGTPPVGLYAPVRGFGNLYVHRPDLHERLGWATTPEVGYTMTVETVPGGSGRYPGIGVYFTLPDGRAIELYPFSSTWQQTL